MEFVENLRGKIENGLKMFGAQEPGVVMRTYISSSATSNHCQRNCKWDGSDITQTRPLLEKVEYTRAKGHGVKEMIHQFISKKNDPKTRHK